MNEINYSRNDRELKELGNKQIRTVGLTGGIASGKTAVTAALEKHGFTVIDADEISRALTAPGSPAERELMRMFPETARDNKLDRRALRALIATDSLAMSRLNEFTHPLIIDSVKRRLQAESGKKVLCAPLLFETGLCSLCDATVCVYAPRRTRIERLDARDGVTRAEAESIIDAQIPDEYRSTLCDFALPTDMDLSDLEKEAVDLFSRIFAASAT